MNQRVYSKIALGLCLSALAIVSCTKKEEANKSESTPAAKTDAPSASAGGCGASCACH